MAVTKIHSVTSTLNLAIDYIIKAKDKDKFFREHESELMIFGSAKKAVKSLLQDNGKLPNVQTLQRRYDELNDKRTVLMKRYGEIKTEIIELERLKDNVEKMERSERTKTRNDDITWVLSSNRVNT